jgi:hypothetical protein
MAVGKARKDRVYGFWGFKPNSATSSGKEVER